MKIASAAPEGPSAIPYCSELSTGPATLTLPIELAHVSSHSAQCSTKSPNTPLLVSGVSASSLLTSDALSTAIQAHVQQRSKQMSSSATSPPIVPSQSSLAHVTDSLLTLGLSNNLAPMQLNYGPFFSPTASQLGSGTYDTVPMASLGFGAGPMSNSAIASGFADSANPNAVQGLGVTFPSSAPSAISMRTMSNPTYLSSTPPIMNSQTGMITPLWNPAADQPDPADDSVLSAESM
ncbi:hypothetical protein DL89DRAFT_259859 [Linderina pennispora]|uniref:Uncharacterized protein n=1 Tax=Linderina pennispora TaxID=61395 RepID=A0A1Y1VZM7_9FUNG|nr:uncharacterized protein DL89DRAFT_259859 [Linderina pennispora]ORX66727.1 hypothetical protein DL89DRAFT_259859 [Linderina pennispora]